MARRPAPRKCPTEAPGRATQSFATSWQPPRGRCAHAPYILAFGAVSVPNSAIIRHHEVRTLWGLAVLDSPPFQPMPSSPSKISRTRFAMPRAFTVVADPSAVTTTAKLTPTGRRGFGGDVTAFGYHELTAESRLGDGALLTRSKSASSSRSSRGDTGMAFPPFTPYPHGH
jgi:hypothetical protein